jgi:hypothetical protein
LRPDQIDADIEALVHAAWLQAEDEVWRLEAYFRVRELAKRYPPADLFATRLGEGRILPITDR